ncbi:MAG: hypothetical protein GF387_01295 [Candidatus Portnoybacteria bacterium]|nr:hypothetical protein [Candidatus Portnoybacteria bacterium]
MKKEKQKGVSLLLTLLIMAALLAVAFGLSRLSLGEIKLARDIPKSLVAFYAADSGIERAIYQDRVLGSISNFNDCVDDSDEICYEVTTEMDGSTRVIISNGSYKDIQRAIEIRY